MHLLIQNVIRDGTEAEQVPLFIASSELVDKHFPWGRDVANLEVCRNYLSQAQTCVAYAQELEITSHIVTHLLESIAGYFEITGLYGEAFVLYKRALEIIDQKFGIDHIDSAGLIVGSGNIYLSQGKHNEAITQYERALRIYEKAFGVDHINTADTIMGIGLTYDNQGKYDEAITQYERALRIKEKAFGVDHINTANTINNLGLTYDNQGKYDEAITQYERALRI